MGWGERLVKTRPAVILAVLAAVVLVGGAVFAVSPTRDAGHGPEVAQVAPQPVPPQPPPPPPSTPPSAQPRLAADPVALVDGLVADERALRDPSSSEAVLLAAARRQQVAYRVLGRHPEWDALVRPRVPGPLLEVYDRNIDARRQLTSMSTGRGKPTLPAWRIEPPAPAPELVGYYHESEAASGVAWNYLAAIHLVETAFGRIAGVSTAGAQGPMQFLPSTFASYGAGGDITAERDSIMAAGRFLAAHGFARNRDAALYRYNNSNKYVRAVTQYATLIGADPAAFAGFYRWDVYYNSSAGDVVLPVGYAAAEPIRVEDYLARYPQ